MSTSPKRSLKRTCAGVSAGALALTGFAAGFAAAATSASATQSFTFSRLAGSDRFGTAAAIATNTFPGGAATVLIANGDTGHFPDALAGNYLAGQDGAPILLTHVNSLPTATSDALTALKAKNVVILGQTSAVGSTVEADLKAKGYTVTRIGGVDRYATARDIAEAPGATAVGNGGNSGPTAILASGADFPDALVAGPLGYAGKLPVMITDPNTLSSATQTALQDLKIKNVIISGGDKAVSSGTESQVKNLNGGITITRLSGATRTQTATAIADYAIAHLGFTNKHVNLARGDDFPDALTGGPHAGVEKAPIILANDPNTLGTGAGDWLKANSGTLTDGHIFGAFSAISNAVQSEATADARGTSTTTVSSSNSTVAPGGTSTISVTGAQPNTALTFSVPANCGTVSPTNATTDANGKTSSTFTASSTASGSCTITVKDAAGNTVGTSTVTVTPASSNQTYTATAPASAQTVSVSTTANPTAGNVSYTFTNLGTSPVDIALFPCHGSTSPQTTNGTTTFSTPTQTTNGTTTPTSGNANGQGTTDTNKAFIESVGGVPTAGGNTNVNTTREVDAVTPANGAVTFILNSFAPDCAIPVVFNQGAAGSADQNNLQLGANGQPTSKFGTGPSTTWTGAPAANGQYSSVQVISVDHAAKTFQGSTTNTPAGVPSGTYTFSYGNANGGNTYYYSTPNLQLSPAQFDQYLSGQTNTVAQHGQTTNGNTTPFVAPGDNLDVLVNNAGPTEFDFNSDVPAAPTNLTATYNPAKTTTNNGATTTTPQNVQLTWTAPPNPDVAYYNIYRATNTTTNGTTTTGSYQNIGDTSSNTAGSNPNGAPGQPQPTTATPTSTSFTDSTATTANTTYSYVVTAVPNSNNGGINSESPASNAATATTGAAPVTPAPQMTAVTIGSSNPGNGTNAPAPGTATVTYNEPVTCATGAGPDFTYSNTNSAQGGTGSVTGASCAQAPAGNYNGGTANGGATGNTLVITFPTSTGGTTPTAIVVAPPVSGDTFTYTSPTTPTAGNAVYAVDYAGNPVYAPTQTLKATSTSNTPGNGTPGANNNPVGSSGQNTGATLPLFRSGTPATHGANSAAGAPSNAPTYVIATYNQLVDCATLQASKYTINFTTGFVGSLPATYATCPGGAKTGQSNTVDIGFTPGATYFQPNQGGNITTNAPGAASTGTAQQPQGDSTTFTTGTTTP